MKSRLSGVLVVSFVHLLMAPQEKQPLGQRSPVSIVENKEYID